MSGRTRRVLLLLGLLVWLGLVAPWLSGCQGAATPAGSSALDPHALPEFGTRTAAADEAQANDDPQNDDVAIIEPLDRTFAGQRLHLPGGASRSAQRLLDCFERDADLARNLRGARVLELGSGTGLAGLAAVVLGAESVTFTDQSVVMEVLRANVTPNLTPLQQSRVRFEELLWGTADASHPLAGERFDVILAADLVYAKEAMQPLVETIRQFSGPQTITYLAYVQRFPWAREFFDEMDRSHTRRLIDRGNGVWIFAFRPR